MKRLILFFSLVLLASCNGGPDSDPWSEEFSRNTNFDVPALTDDNTIRFSFSSGSGGGTLEVILMGDHIAVDWGDDSVTKDIHPENGKARQPFFRHTYTSSGDFTVRIWSSEVEFISVSALGQNFGVLHIGNCPALKYAHLNSFSSNSSLDLSGCPALRQLNLGNWAQLQSLDLDGCTQLEQADFYTLPSLRSLDLSGNENLAHLRCPDSALTELILDGCDRLFTIDFSRTRISSFDFSQHPLLANILCSGSDLTELDVSANERLRFLECMGLGLTSLDLSGNPLLSELHATDNSLTELDVTANQSFRFLHIDNNLLSADSLNAIFSALPSFDASFASSASFASRMPPPPPRPSAIWFSGNPGSAACDVTILADKHWVVK